MNKTILVIEDDKDLQEYLTELLTTERYIVYSASTGIKGKKLLEKIQPDLIILDLNLPDIKGETLAKEFKNDFPQIPIIIVTADDRTQSVTRNLRQGADDYIKKPFDSEELLARIQVRLRRQTANNPLLEANDLKLNTETLEVTRNGRSIDLTHTELELLRYLLENKNKVLSREMILSKVWSASPDIETRVVDVYIGYLRKKIDKDKEANEKLIHSKRGFGYLIKE